MRVQGQENNPLYDVTLEVGAQNAYWYDSHQIAMDSIRLNFEEVLSGAQNMITYLHETKSVGSDHKKPFEILNGKLVRTHFSCKKCSCLI